MKKFLEKVKPGDTISAGAWNELIDYINRSGLIVNQGSGLVAQETPDGTVLSLARGGQRFLCVANGNITARSGTTPGTGSVFLVTLSGTTLATTTVSYAVYNPSSSTMSSTHGIDSGQYCLIEEVPSGRWLVTPLECS